MMESWKTFGHGSVKGILDRQIKSWQLPHAYLFSGPDGIGKKTLALEFAAKILGADRLASHPDFLMLDQEEEISVEQVRGFIARLGLKPLAGSKKVAIINDAHLLNTQSGNALLKTLEEPSSGTVLVLAGDGRRLLPTIRSRCLILSMQPFTTAQLREFSRAKGVSDSPEMVALSFGCPGRLVALAENPSLFQEMQRELKRWQELKSSGSAERLLSIAELAEMEGEELGKLVETWLLGEGQALRSEPENFLSVAALQDAVVALRSNQNKKSILQNLFLKM